MLCTSIRSEGIPAELPSGAGPIDERRCAKLARARNGSHYTRMRTEPKPDAIFEKIPVESPEVSLGRRIRLQSTVGRRERSVVHIDFTNRRFWGPPELDRAVVAARGEDGTVGRKRGGVHGRLVPP
jgi:hypothetical protein